MRVLIIGHLVLDEIHTREGGVIESFGGIHFPVTAFSALATEDDTVVPVFPVGEDTWDPFQAAAARMPRLDVSRCTRVSAPNTRVRLFHDADASYNTQLVRSLDSISYASVAPELAAADLVYINFMTGADLALDDAERLRSDARGMIYLDAHMIAYRVAPDGHRSTAPVDAWRRWIAIPDVLQCNERELAALVPGADGERAAAEALFSMAALRMLVVTKGGQGAVVHARDSAPLRIDAAPVEAIVDTTGCGDVFGSTFAYFLARGETAANAGARAAAAGAFVASIPGSHGMEGLGRAVRGGGA